MSDPRFPRWVLHQYTVHVEPSFTPGKFHWAAWRLSNQEVQEQLSFMEGDADTEAEAFEAGYEHLRQIVEREKTA